MKRPLGCLSIYGLFASLLTLIGVGLFILWRGATSLSPGPVTAVSRGSGPTLGYATHADFERQCTFCHQPWEGVNPAYCLMCHATVEEQIATGTGLHSYLQDAENCAYCHTEHRGRQANITLAVVASFPHDQIGFSLVQHQQLADGTTFGCSDCHTSLNYAVEEATCGACHSTTEAAFVEQHVATHGSDCLTCHDGSGYLSGLDHSMLFPLQNGHKALRCRDCHTGDTLQMPALECVACHAEPEVHVGQFGTTCVYCHGAEGWLPARFQYHVFPLDHGDGAESECQVCHSSSYATYTCYNCHEHRPAEIEKTHTGAGIADIQDCGTCHTLAEKQRD